MYGATERNQGTKVCGNTRLIVAAIVPHACEEPVTQGRAEERAYHARPVTPPLPRTPAGSGGARALHPIPPIAYPESLPVSARRDEIARAIREHPVVIVCGETGSGKTTQLPKIALELGRGLGAG